MDLARNYIVLLGPAMVHVDGQRVQHFRSRKTLALLTYLIVEQRPMARNYLASIFWPDIPLGEARAHLRRSLYDLTQKIPARILIEDDVVIYDRKFFPETDLCQFDDLVAAGDTASLAKAAKLCRGELLEGITLDDCPAFESWLTVERESWRRKEVKILSQLMDLYNQNGQYDEASGLGWQLVHLQPWREEHYRQLMFLLARNGDPAMALKVFKRGQLALTEENGEEPSTEMFALRDKIRQLMHHPPANIPHETTSFIGRTQEFDTLFRTIVHRKQRLITITGPSGIGKSRLAINAGIKANGPAGYLFLDGIFLIHLDYANSADTFTAALGHSMKLTSAKKPISLDFILRYLQNKEMLLILDDFDLPIEHRGVLTTILDAAPGITLLVTSLSRLKLVGEWTFPLKGLSTNDSEQERTHSEAMELLLNRLENNRSKQLSATEIDILQQICRLVEGMPLALELAAGWVQTLRPRYVLEELKRNSNLMSSMEMRAPRHASIRAALDFTWSHLEQNERESLIRLSDFGKEFTVEEAIDVAHVEPSVLTALVDWALVSQFLDSAGDPDPIYYLIHSLVRTYVGEQKSNNVSTSPLHFIA